MSTETEIVEKKEEVVIDEQVKKTYQSRYEELLGISKKMGDAGLLFHIKRLIHGKEIQKSVISDPSDFFENFEDYEKFDKFIREKRKKVGKDVEIELKLEENMIQIWVGNECNAVVVDFYESKARYWLKYGLDAIVGFDQEAAEMATSHANKIKVKFRPSITDIITFHTKENKSLKK